MKDDLMTTGRLSRRYLSAPTRAERLSELDRWGLLEVQRAVWARADPCAAYLLQDLQTPAEGPSVSPWLRTPGPGKGL